MKNKYYEYVIAWDVMFIEFIAFSFFIVCCRMKSHWKLILYFGLVEFHNFLLS